MRAAHDGRSVARARARPDRTVATVAGCCWRRQRALRGDGSRPLHLVSPDPGRGVPGAGGPRGVYGSRYAVHPPEGAVVLLLQLLVLVEELLGPGGGLVACLLALVEPGPDAI